MTQERIQLAAIRLRNLIDQFNNSNLFNHDVLNALVDVQTILGKLENLESLSQEFPIDSYKIAGYNKGLEDAADYILALGTNNVGMVNDMDRRRVDSIKAMRKPLTTAIL